MVAKISVVFVATILVVFPVRPHAQETQAEPTAFAENVLLHVILHEIGHAVIREFDLAILGNEETMADAFATCYLVHHLPNRAFDVLNARVTSLMIEASETPRNQWTVKGEHDNDARRAHQIVAIALAADAAAFGPLADQLGMTDAEIKRAEDYGAEIHRSWRRVLKPLLMPEGMRSKEARVRFDANDELVNSLRTGRLPVEIETALRHFDWHSEVTVFFMQGDGGAGWNRSERTITVHTEYIRRFIAQGDRTKR
jgi:hypothetical protein